MHISDQLRMGPVFLPNPNPAASGSSPQELGVGPLGRTLVYDIVPLTLQAAALAASQAVAGAKNLTLTAGTGVTATVDATGATRYVLDVPRTLSVVSAGAGDTTQTVTFSGYDVYGQQMTQTVTLNGVTTVNTTKAFASITNIAISAATAGNVTAGYGDTFGLPVAVRDAGYIESVKWAGALAADAGTFTAAVATSPATALTGDVRGTYKPSSASNGTNRLVVCVAMTDVQVGPFATRVGAAGVTQA